MWSAASLELLGETVRLDPLRESDVESLLAAATEDRTHYALTRVPETTGEMALYVQAALEERQRGEAVPFVVRRIANHRVLGTTRYLDLGFWRVGRPPGEMPSVAEIGSTWYAASAQRTRVNTEAKLLLLTHAFDMWKTYRVSFQTDARNERSRAAIERLGATFEGVRRAHKQASDGTARDSAFYSLLEADWPSVQARLRQRLERGYVPIAAGLAARSAAFYARGLSASGCDALLKLTGPRGPESNDGRGAPMGHPRWPPHGRDGSPFSPQGVRKKSSSPQKVRNNRPPGPVSTGLYRPGQPDVSAGQSIFSAGTDGRGYPR